MDEAEFIKRFGDRLVAVVGTEEEADLRAYASRAAPSYYRDPEFLDDDGSHDPGGCADVDMSYWDKD